MGGALYSSRNPFGGPQSSEQEKDPGTSGISGRSEEACKGAGLAMAANRRCRNIEQKGANNGYGLESQSYLRFLGTSQQRKPGADTVKAGSGPCLQC